MMPYRLTLAREEVLIAEIDCSQIEPSQQAFIYLHNAVQSLRVSRRDLYHVNLWIGVS
jgi:hypothetical protein